MSNLEVIFDSLNRVGIIYLVADGIAVNTHGYQRMTSDLDLVIQLDTDNITRAMNTLKRLDYTPIMPVSVTDFADQDKRKNWVETRNMQVFSLQSDQYPETTIDIFATEPFNFDHEYSKSIRAELTPKICFNVVSIQTLIKMKQSASRARDIDDIEHLELILNEENEH